MNFFVYCCERLAGCLSAARQFHVSNDTTFSGLKFISPENTNTMLCEKLSNIRHRDMLIVSNHHRSIFVDAAVSASIWRVR